MSALTRAVAVACGIVLVGWSTPATAGPRVDVGNESGEAAVDPTYLTPLTVRGSGFQSVRNGHGGIYVFFGTVQPGWRPSQGGQTGRDYFYVPDSEARNNQGYQRFVAFPGSDTAGSANGGTMTASGSWSTSLQVPGAVFDAYDRSGGSRTIDCREVTCGIITVGAHGVVNARNESFTPVRVKDLYASAAPTDAAPTDAAPAAGSATGQESPRKGTGRAAPASPAAVEVDRASARPGHVLAFTASGLQPGAQVSALLDDGTAGAGPFLVGQDGRLAGVLTLPVDVEAGTHELRLYGVADPPSVRFAVIGVGDEAPVVEDSTSPDAPGRAALVFVVAAALVLLLALGRLVLRRRQARHG